MSLSKEISVDKIEVLEDGTLQVRNATKILENNKVISTQYHRHTVAPTISASALALEDSKVQAIAAAVHTEDIKTAYAAKIADTQTEVGNG